MTEQGERVIAILDADDERIRLIGHGVYVGRRAVEGLMFPTNPYIELDLGGHVWGYECWWGPEDTFDEEYIAEREVEFVGLTPVEARRETPSR